ncbi:MAG TPA: tetratricopeptide repeat protein [Candidatus Sulfotelmatobacter sp.]|nr:tetratricopeptide repeat protein [Candidatus Sulfotelmatobacter sp.]
MNLRRLGCGAVVLALLAWGTAAEARNPHCAGGIQYVVGGLRDKQNGNTEDYMRQMNKAVAQLEQCAAEDPDDAEALGYLGWAYAEIDSSCQAGKVFASAIEKLKAKGDAKKAEWAANNRDSYWANAFNDGIGKINAAQAAYPDYTKNPENDADKTLKEEAGKNYQQAIASLDRANCLRPNHPQTIRNLGSVYVFLGDYKTASDIYTAGLKVAPSDSSLIAGLKSARTGYANQLLEDKKYDEAVSYYQDLLKGDPTNSELQSSIADARFQQAQKDTSKAGKAAYFKQAGDAYAKAFTMKSDNADLAFNAALAYQNAGEPTLSEAQWRNALKLKPNDADALSSLAAVLADQKKYDEASKILLQALASNPQNKTLHRQLGGVYTRGGYNAKANEELMIFLAMQNGQPAADAAAAAKGNTSAGAAGAKALASNGAPDQVIDWEASGEKYSTWFYWSKKQALHFKDGALIVTSDWSAGPSGKK